MSEKTRWWAAGIAVSWIVSSVFTIGVMRWEHVDFAGQGGNALSALPKFQSIYRILLSDYYQKLNPNTLENGAITGMVTSLHDPFSEYMNPTQANAFNEQIDSSFQGIGAVMQDNNGVIEIESVLKGSPAAKASIRRDDEIQQVNGRSTKGMALSNVQSLIRGPSGTKVELTLYRPATKATLHFTLVRARIDEQTVNATYYKGKREAYIQITQFSERTASEFENNLTAMQKDSNADGGKLLGMIIDLRQDPGGLLQSVQSIASDLLPKGKLIVQIAYGKGKTYHITSDRDGLGIPIVCIIDGGSASAAEILAGAVRDSGHGLLVGDRSFGKGTVQVTKAFQDGSSLKYTVAKWLTPNGDWIHKIGLQPDVNMPLPDYDQLAGLSPEKTLKYDMNNTDVQVLQRMLKALGYNPDRTDGYFSQATSAAVEAFQKTHSLSVTGAVDAATAQALNNALVVTIQANDTQLQAAQSALEKLVKQAAH